MSAALWLIGLILGIITAVGLSLMIMAILLNRSNNLGDSTAKSKDFTSGISYLVHEEGRRNYETVTSEHFIQASIEALISDGDYRFHADRAIKANRTALVTRHVVTDEEVDSFTDAPLDNPSGETPVVESSWAAARRRNLGEQASINPWGRDKAWGAKPSAEAEKTSGSTSTLSGAGSSGASAFGEETVSSPIEEPIYEAPTATRPLWENTDANDDFSDFEDM